MITFRACRLRIAISVVLVTGSLLIAACGQGDEVVSGAAGDGSTELSTEVAQRVADVTNPSVLALARGHLLVAGGIEIGDSSARIRSTEVLLDVSTGKEQTVKAPLADGPVMLLGATGAKDGSFVAIGSRCPEGNALPVVEPRSGCANASGTAFVLREGVWSELPFPDSVAPARPAGTRGFSGSVTTAVDGTVFAIVRTQGPNQSSRDVALALNGGTWTPIASSASVAESCATRSALQMLVKDTSTSPATVDLLSTTPGEDTVKVALPELDLSAAAAMVHLACDSDAVYLTSPPKEIQGASTLYSTTDAGQHWAADALTAGAIPDPEQPLSSAVWVGIRAVLDPSAPSNTSEKSVPVLLRARGAGKVDEPLTGAPAASWLVADAPSNQVVMVGPIPGLATLAADQEPDPTAPIGMEYIE